MVVNLVTLTRETGARERMDGPLPPADPAIRVTTEHAASDAGLSYAYSTPVGELVLDRSAA